jgi:hypothetical protein
LPCEKLKVVSGARIGFRQAAIEHLDDLIGHVGQALGEEGDQDGIAAHRQGALECLGAGLAGQMCQELEAVGIERLQRPVFHASGPQEGELLQIAEDRPRGARDRRAPQPGQRRQAPRGVGFQQGIEEAPAVVREERRELPKRCRLRSLTRFGDESIEPRHPGPETLVAPEFLTGKLIKQRRFIVFQRPLQQPISKRLKVFSAHLVIAQMDLGHEQVILARVCPGAVRRQHLGLYLELLGEKRQGRGRGRGEVVRHKAHEAEGAELEGIAQTVVCGTIARNAVQIPLG